MPAKVKQENIFLTVLTLKMTGLKIKYNYFIFMACFLLTLSSFGQNIMVLQRGSNEKTRIKYEEGDQLTYLQEGLDYYITDIITEISKDYIALSENVITPKQVVSIDIRNKDERNRTLSNLTLLPAAGGILLLLAESINSLYSDGGLSYNNETLIISGTLLASSLVMSQLRYKKFKPNRRNKIQLIPFREVEISEGKEE